MLENKDTALETFIQVYENMISDEVIDAVMQEYLHNEDWRETTLGPDNQIDQNIRRCDVVDMSQGYVLNRTNTEHRQSLDHEVFNAASGAIYQYNMRFPGAQISRDSGYNLLRYRQGGYYIQHTDSYTQQPRAVSCSFILNDDYEGGEFSFFNDQIRYKLPKGSCIMFPSNFMYPHQVMPVTQGTRYSIVTWFI
jgi:predicted 2-oxoglutarate/Fe(II)-dependent dioxygenase YbiX